MLCPFQCSILLPFKNSQFLWMLATLTGGNGANLRSDPKLCSVAATTAGENQRGWIREIFPPAKKISDKTFQRENKRKKNICLHITQVFCFYFKDSALLTKACAAQPGRAEQW